MNAPDYTGIHKVANPGVYTATDIASSDLVRIDKNKFSTSGFYWGPPGFFRILGGITPSDPTAYNAFIIGWAAYMPVDGKVSVQPPTDYFTRYPHELYNTSAYYIVYVSTFYDRALTDNGYAYGPGLGHEYQNWTGQFTIVGPPIANLNNNYGYKSHQSYIFDRGDIPAGTPGTTAAAPWPLPFQAAMGWTTTRAAAAEITPVSSYSAPIYVNGVHDNYSSIGTANNYIDYPAVTTVYTLTVLGLDGTTITSTFTAILNAPNIHATASYSELKLIPSSSTYLLPTSISEARLGLTPGIITDTPSARSVTASRKILLPFLDCDDVSGRLYCVTGMVTFDAKYTETVAANGTASLALAGYANHKSYPIRLATSQAGNGACPFSTGRDIGFTGTPGDVWLPDSLLILPEEGRVRVGVRAYSPAAAGGGLLRAIAAWRDTQDLGLTWAAGPVSWAANVALGAAAMVRSWRGGDRSRRALIPDTTLEPPVAAEAQGGASNWAQNQNQWIAQRRLPVWVSRSAPGTFAGRTAPEGAGDNPGGISAASRYSTDSGLTVLNGAAPTVGGVDASQVAVPGYPFAGNWAGVSADTQPLFGFPAAVAAGGYYPVVSPAGGLTWARGYNQQPRVYLFCPAIMREPIPRASYTPLVPDKAEAGFLQSTDAEGARSGADWGHDTCIVFAQTGDAGNSYGPLGLVRVGGVPLLFKTDSVRIAACCGPGDTLYLCVGSEGVAILLSSTDGGASFQKAGFSPDAGATWRQMSP